MFQKKNKLNLSQLSFSPLPFLLLSLNNKLRNACGSTQTPPCGWPSSGSSVLSIRALKTSSTTGFSNQQTTDGMASSWMKNAFCESILSQSAKVSQRWRWRLLHQINFFFFFVQFDLWPEQCLISQYVQRQSSLLYCEEEKEEENRRASF